MSDHRWRTRAGEVTLTQPDRDPAPTSGSIPGAERLPSSALAAQAREHDRTGRHGAAAAIWAALADREPGEATHLGNLSSALHRLGDLERARVIGERALSAAPDSAALHYNLGNLHDDAEHLEAAEDHFRRAIALAPDFAAAHNNLGAALLKQGRAREAVAAFRSALAALPDYPEAELNVLLTLNCDETASSDAVFEAHRAWGARLRRRVHALALPAGHDRDTDRRLRVGYVSSDFVSHPVGFFIEPVLRAHDRSRVEVLCFASTRSPDSVTARLRGLADRWFDVRDTDDDAICDQVRALGVDILVDLSGHTRYNRLAVFARRAAPVQVSWLGYFNTTGVDEMDYLLASDALVPPGLPQRFTETVERLPGVHWCYEPPPEAPPVASTPLLARGTPTFGCFNNLAKVGDETIAAWASILVRVPQGRLLLKFRGLSDASVCDHVRARFARAGVAPDRLLLRGHSERERYLAEHADVDLMLDPFPYSGGTITCDALWMGVPVVSIAGDRLVSRLSTQVLTTLGLDELVATDTEDYVEIAAALASNPRRLTALRAGMRDRIRSSVMGNPRRFTRGLEDAYRRMWRRWCEERSGASC